jgi:hypothetical protein
MKEIYKRKINSAASKRAESRKQRKEIKTIIIMFALLLFTLSTHSLTLSMLSSRS